MSEVGTNPSSDEPAASESTCHPQQPAPENDNGVTDDKFVLTLLMDSQQWVNPESFEDPTKHQRHVVKHLKTKKGVDTQLVTPSLPAGNYLWTMRRTSDQETSVLDEQACPVLDVIVLRVEYSHLISKAWKKSKRYHPLSTLELWHRKMQFSSMTRKILIVQGGPSEAEVASNNKKATQVQDLLAEYPDDFELYELSQAKDTVKLLKQLHQEIYESLQTQTNDLGTYLQNRLTLAQLRLQVETSLHSPKFHLELSLRRHVFAKNQQQNNSDSSTTPDYVTILKGIWEKVLDTYHQSEPALEEAVATNAAEQVVKLGLLLSSSSSTTILSDLLSNPEEARAIAKDFVESHKLQRWRAASLESELSVISNKQEESIEQPAAANPVEQGDSIEPDQLQEGEQTGMSMEQGEGDQQPEAPAPMEEEVEIVETVAAPAPAPSLSQPQQEEDDTEFQQLVNAIWLINLRSDEAARHAKEGLCQHFSNMQGVLQALSSGGESRRQAIIVVKALFAAHGISLAPPSAPTSASSSRRESLSGGMEDPAPTAPADLQQQQSQQQQEVVTVDLFNAGLHKVHQRIHHQSLTQATAIQDHFQELYKMMERALQFNREALKTQQTQHKQHISALQRQHKTFHDQVMQSLVELRNIIQGGQEIGQKDLHTCTHALIKGIEKAYATMSAEYQRYHVKNVQQQQQQQEQESKVTQQEHAQALLKAQEQRRRIAQNLEQRHSHSAQQVAPLPSHHPLEAAPTPTAQLNHHQPQSHAPTIPHQVHLAHQLAQQQTYHHQQAQHAQLVLQQKLARQYLKSQQAQHAPVAILPPPEFEPPNAPPPSNPILSSAMLQSNDDDEDEVQIVDPPSAAVGEKRARPEEEGKEEESASTPVNNHKRAKEGEKDHGSDDLDLSDTDDEG